MDLNLGLNVDLNVPQTELQVDGRTNDQHDEDDDIDSVHDSEYEGDSSDNVDSNNEEQAVMDDEGHRADETEVQVNMFQLTGNKAFDNIGNSIQIGDVVKGIEAVSVEGLDSETGSEDESGFSRSNELREIIRGMENNLLQNPVVEKYFFSVAKSFLLQK